MRKIKKVTADHIMVRLLAAAGQPNLAEFSADGFKLIADRVEFRFGEHTRKVNGSVRNVLRAGAEKVLADGCL